MNFISGFTYIRNGFTYGYPFIPSILSILPLVDELIVVVGDSTDGTREAVAAIEDPKIRIIDTVWDDAMRDSGKIFAHQTNLGLAEIKGDWAFHIQADEVLHEKDYPLIRQAIAAADKDERIDGILFPFLHFWGDFEHIRQTRRVHANEIRIFKHKAGNTVIKSYKDSQGFRKYPSEEAYALGDPGTKLNVLKTPAHIYHYSYARHPYLMSKKAVYFHRFWHDDEWLNSIPKEDLFDFNAVDRLETFKGSHPQYMLEIIAAKNWEFTYDPSRSNMKTKDKLVYLLNKLTGRTWFEYRNYRLVKK